MAKNIVSIEGVLVEFSLIMEKHGWITMQFIDKHQIKDSQPHHVALSFVFKPLEDLFDWLLTINKKAFPAEVEIDQEGCESILSVCNHSQIKDAILFQDMDKHSRKPDYENTFFYKDFITALRQEFYRFFEEDYDPLHWDKYGLKPDDAEYHQAGLKEKMLENEWLRYG